MRHRPTPFSIAFFGLFFTLTIVPLGCGGGASTPDDEKTDVAASQPDAMMINSPFYSPDCCPDREIDLAGLETTSLEEDCCCTRFFNHYGEMKKSSDGRIPELKMTDPILNHCRGKYPQEWEKVDNPTTAPVNPSKGDPAPADDDEGLI